jgi:hypothetical protein
MFADLIAVLNRVDMKPPNEGPTVQNGSRRTSRIRAAETDDAEPQRDRLKEAARDVASDKDGSTAQ